MSRRTDQTVLSELQRLVLETPNGGASWGTNLWTATEVRELLNEQLARVARRLQTTLAMGALTSIGTMANRYDVPNDCLQPLYADWQGADGTWTAMHETSQWDLDHGLDAWEIEPGVPLYWSAVDGPQKQILVAPAPRDAGVVWLTYVVAPARSVSGSPVTMTIPDELVEIAKWSALAQMFTKAGRGADLTRGAVTRWLGDLLLLGAETLLTPEGS